MPLKPSMNSEVAWLDSVRAEFPGLAAAKDWILCDSPTGTQVHQVESRERERRLNLTNEFQLIINWRSKNLSVFSSLSEIAFLLFLSAQSSCWPQLAKYLNQDLYLQDVIAAIAAKLSSTGANLGGSYPSGLETIRGVARAREVAATFFNCSAQAELPTSMLRTVPRS